MQPATEAVGPKQAIGIAVTKLAPEIVVPKMAIEVSKPATGFMAYIKHFIKLLNSVYNCQKYGKR